MGAVRLWAHLLPAPPSLPVPSAASCPNGRCLPRPFPSKPQIIDCANSEPQRVFIILPSRHSAGVLLEHAAVPECREGRGEERTVSAPLPHPLAGEASGRILASGPALPVSSWSPRRPAQHPSPALSATSTPEMGTCLKARQPRGQLAIVEKVPETSFPHGTEFFMCGPQKQLGGGGVGRTLVKMQIPRQGLFHKTT